MLKRACLLTLFAACGSVSGKATDAAIDAPDIDAAGSDAAPDGPPGLKPWGTPVKLDVVNDPTNGTGDASIT
ncbi:MAG TPA: hypothetical protein VGM39_06005, partial [Kofleriaceae bacterium]